MVLFPICNKSMTATTRFCRKLIQSIFFIKQWLLTMMWTHRWKTFNHIWCQWLLSKKSKPIHRWTGSFVKYPSTLFSVNFFSFYVILPTWNGCCAAINTFFSFVFEFGQYWKRQHFTTAYFFHLAAWPSLLFQVCFLPQASFSFVMTCSCCLSQA